MSVQYVGKVDIYADTGLDEWELVKKQIKREISRKKIKVGQRQVMPVNFDGKDYLLEIEVKEFWR